jgi:hypothetical protein
MSEKERGNDFEERLLVRLKAVVAEGGASAAAAGEPIAAGPGPRRRRPLRLVLAGAVALAVAAVIFIVSSGSGDTTRAFAVEPQAGGGVAIKIFGLEEAAALEAALERAGIRAQIDWLPAQTTCAERKLTPSTVRNSMGGQVGGFEVGGGSGPGLTIGVMTAAQYRALVRANDQRARAGDGGPPSVPNFSFEPHSFRADQSVVIVGSPEPHGGDPEGGYRASVQVVEGPVPPCVPVPEAAGSIGAIQLPAGAGEGASAAAAAALPKPGQFLFTKSEVVQLEGWEPSGPGTGPKAHPRHFTTNLTNPRGHALPAFVKTTKEVWTALSGHTRVRETMTGIEFLSPADQRRWEAAGSPPPFAYDPAEHHVRRDSAGRPYKEFASRNWRGKHVFADADKLFGLPTEAAALRLAIEGRSSGDPQPASSRNGTTTIQRLIEILTEPIASAELRAAAFAALGEIPGVGHEADITDAAGRTGEALNWVGERGFGRRVIFDPKTSRLLAEAEVIFGPPSSHEYGVPAGTPYRETAPLSAGVVDSAQGETSAR